MRIVEPEQASHTYTQRLVAPPEAVFPLLCPVRECDWIHDWEPGLVVTSSGLAEDGCIFTTPAAAGESIWVVTAWEPPARIEFVKVTPGETVGRIHIALEPDGAGGTLAHVRYTFTSIGERGGDAVRAFTAGHYVRFMREWEDQLNHYLRTGRMLEPAAL